MTKTFEMTGLSDGITSQYFNENDKNSCLNYFSENVNYQIGSNIMYCYVKYNNYSPDCVCRYDIKSDITNNCCHNGYLNNAVFMITVILFGVFNLFIIVFFFIF